MYIKKMTISNFRSFDHLEIALNDFNILIGSNASGKSNFIEVFKFLRNITNHGLKNAISMQGGVEYLRNISLNSSQELSLQVIGELNGERFVKEKGKHIIGIRTEQFICEFSIVFDGKNGSFRVVHDQITREYQFWELEEKEGELEEKSHLGFGKISFMNQNGHVDYHLDVPTDLPVEIEIADLLFLSPASDKIKLSQTSLLLETPFFLAIPVPKKIFDTIPIYDFDPRLPRRSTPITGKTELEEDGSNLAIVLKNILENPKTLRKFVNLLTELLPFVDDLRIEKFMDKSLFFAIKEQYNHDIFLPASLLSDGTISVTAFIIALYFEHMPFIIFEEPERNIHPSLLTKIMNMMKEVSQEKQIIVTTHNPQIVKHADVENLLFISRDKQGFSTISIPSQQEDIRVFLKNEIGVEDLFIQGLLGA